MKRCNQMKNLIQKYIDKEISQQEEKILKEHIEKCKDCLVELNYYLKIKENLALCKPPELSDKFYTKLHSKLLETSYENMIEKKFISVFSKYAAVTALFFIVIFGFLLLKEKKIIFVYNQPYSTDYYNEYNLTGYEIREDLPVQEEGYIRIKLNAKKELKGVKVEVELPDGIVSADGGKIFYWEGDLKPQENYLKIKVKAVKEGEYPIKIKIKKDSSEKNIVKKVNVVRI